MSLQDLAINNQFKAENTIQFLRPAIKQTVNAEIKQGLLYRDKLMQPELLQALLIVVNFPCLGINCN